jgi:hypothetical protein
LPRVPLTMRSSMTYAQGNKLIIRISADYREITLV